MRYSVVITSCLATLAAGTSPISAAEQEKYIQKSIAALKSSQVQERLQAASTLGDLKATEAIPELTRVFQKDSESFVREVAGRALGKIGTEDARVLPVLIDALKGTNGAMRAGAVSGLQEMGPKAKAAVNPLIAVMNDPKVEKTTRAFAIGLVADFASEDKTVEPALTDALKDPVIGTNAARLLLKVNPKKIELVIETLQRSLKSNDAMVASSAAGSLGDIGPNAKVAIPDLIEALKKGGQVGYYAGQALSAIGPEAVSPVLELAKKKDRNIQAMVIRSLAEMKPPAPAKDAVPVLIEALKDPNPQARYWAASGLLRLGPDAKPAVAALTAALKDPDENVRRWAGSALQAIDPEAAKKAGVSNK